VEGAFKHILTDLYAFIATAIAGLIIILTGFARADAIATLIVVALMLHAGYGLLRDSGRIFLEAAPAGVSPEAIGAAMASRQHVAEIHDLHIWEITSGMPAASAHVLVAPGSDCHAVRADLETFLVASYGITHATLQVDHVPAADPPDNSLTHGSSAGDQHHCEDAHGPSYRPGENSRSLTERPAHVCGPARRSRPTISLATIRSAVPAKATATVSGNADGPRARNRKPTGVGPTADPAE
jgi:cobalt-zinc-cadmium efflux system protein